MHILSFTRALALIELRPGFYDVISLGKDTPNPRRCRNRLWLDFDDRRSLDDLAWDRPDGRVPQPEHVRAALEFARRRKDKSRLIVHCQAGVSRSPGMAWCILLQRTRDPAAATRQVFEIAPYADPNPLLIYYGLEAVMGSVQNFADVYSQIRENGRRTGRLF